MASPLAPTLKVLRCSPSNPDAAIDATAMGPSPDRSESLLSEYIRTRDEELLKLVEGARPEWFHLKRLPMSWCANVLDVVYPRSAQRILAFRAGCHLIEAASPLVVVAPKEKGDFVASRSDFGVTMAPDAWADEIGERFSAEVVQEMGELVIVHSRLKRGARGPFGFWGGSALTP